MQEIDESRIADEIVRLERQWRSLLRERDGAIRLRASWSLDSDELRWHVPLRDVLEPDIDIEVLPSLLVVRAPSSSRRDILFMGLLPVPHGYDAVHARIRAERGYLEIVICRSAEEARR